MGWMTSVKRSRTGAGSPAALRRAIASIPSERSTPVMSAQDGLMIALLCRNDTRVPGRKHLSCMLCRASKAVANRAFAYLAGLQGSIWQDVRLIYLTHSQL